MNTAIPDAQHVAENYIALWNEADESRRLKLLESKR
jgi:hypothetical protein